MAVTTAPGSKQETFKIFVVEDDDFYAKLLHFNLTLNPDYEVEVFKTGKACIDRLHEKPNVITLDFTLPDMSGAEVLKRIQTQDPEISVIMVSGQDDVATAIDLLHQGAYDYIVKDENAKQRLLHSVNQIRINSELKNEIRTLKKEVSQKYNFSNIIIGQSEQIKQTFDLIERAAQTKITVSITGETGTGKELVAKAIHYNSDRRKQPFVAVNVAAIPNDLMESELFGHEKGAFTGAANRRIGKFEEAHHGTLFLDEISEMDVNMQAKLLRVLQEREVTRIGGNDVIPIDVRIIVATHKNMAEEVNKNNFREDLYYRLLGLPIELPPLRERGHDIIIIAKHFVEQFCNDNGMPVKTLSPEAQKTLLAHPYPGNVRELKAVVELACVMTNNNIIDSPHITFNSVSFLPDLMSENLTLKGYEQRIIKHYLNKYNRNVMKVARTLDIGKSTIYRMLKNGELE